jgi:hypothetical protein
MKKRLTRYFAFFMALNIIFEVISPTVALALTNGPHQPEFSGFEPANSSEMVDLFTGDYKYNIPLMDVDGYPLNLAYHAGQNRDAEASWVGLGWSLNPGVLNRMVKGLPDDFNGEIVKSKTHLKPHTTMGVGFQFAAWLGGNLGYGNTGVGDQVGANGAIVMNYNNYKGFGLEIEIDGHNSLTRGIGMESHTKSSGVGMSLSSQDGGELSRNYSNGTNTNYGLPIIFPVNLSKNMGEGTTINTRSGAVTKSYFSSASINVSIPYGGEPNDAASIGLGIGHTSSLPSGPISYLPRISNDMKGGGFGLSVKAGLWANLSFLLNGYPLPISVNGGLMLGFKGFYNRMSLMDSVKRLPSFGYLYAENAGENSLMDFNRFKDGPIMQETPNISFATQTYDMFTATGQGMANNFRAFRSDNGNVHDNHTLLAAENTHGGVELGGIFLAHFQNDITNVVSAGYSGKWNTMLGGGFEYNVKDIKVAANRFYEKYYFKSMGEIAARDGSFDGALGGEAAISPILNKIGDDFHAFSSISAGTRQKRDIRNTYIQSLTGSQAAQHGYESTYDLYIKLSTAPPTINPATRMVDADPTKLNLSRTNKTILTSVNRPIGHHLSEISLTNTAGSRYVYGIPVYNLIKKRVMFNASNRKESQFQQNGWPTTAYSQSPLGKSHAYQLVEYDNTNGSEEINKNFRGYENLYRADSIPAYAHNFLLTSILSQDYVDIKGDGPTYDDLGAFTKFNYYKNNEYGWRDPYPLPVGQSNAAPIWGTNNNGSPALQAVGSTKSQANFEKGMVADELDDKGFYEFGIRENYYMQSIETKNYVAFFETSDRLDQGGVTNEHGAITPGNNQRLDAIKLYSKSEIVANGGSITGIFPIKTVRFEYDYSLCPNTFNSNYNASTNPNHGKLTLKKVYFSYGNSEKSALTPYEFTYTSNYGYDPRSVDRWGNYLPNSGVESGDTTGLINNIEYPYATQDKANTDSYVAAWNISEIKTPSGSTIKINFEADDYGYVQNEQAGQMVNILNLVSSINPSANVASTYGSPNWNIKDANYLIVDMQKMYRGIPTSGSFSIQTNASNYAKTNVFKPNKDLYYKAFTKLGGPSTAFGLKKDYWEYVSGYAVVEDAGVFASSGNTYTDGTGTTCYRYAYIRIKKEIAWDSKDVCPITIAGWDMLRNYLPRVAYPGSEPANMGDNNHKPKKQFMNMLAGIGVALADFINGTGGKPNKRFYDKNFCSRLKFAKSFVRAYVPFKQKIGGGYRVKSITMSDKWDTMTGNQEAKTSYGQMYDYTIKEGKYTISSGVAMYEPILGGDEISLRQPIKFEIEKSMAPNDHLYQEKPFGEMLYPSPMVGYSKVTVTTLPDPENPAPPAVCKIGKTEYEFYTAKDFPITFQSTGLTKQSVESTLLEDYIVMNNTFKIFHAVQGHALKLNDMHGKLKAILTYGEDNLTVPISGTRYFYKCNGAINGSKQLITSLPVINEKNQISSATMSRDIDITTDTGENINESTSVGNNFVFELGLMIILVVIPAPPYVAVLPPLPGIPSVHNSAIFGQQRTGLRQATITKVIQQYGVLEKVESFDNKSKTATENLLWDKNTGDVVLTKTIDNYDQQVYNFNYPAYWAYPRMGHEFNRDGIELLCPGANAATIWDVSSGILQKAAITTPVLLFNSGDEVIVMNASGAKIGNRYWIQQDPYLSNNPTPAPYYLLNENGQILTSTTNTSLTPGGNYIIKLIKPNNQNSLNAGIGSVTSVNDPRVGGGIQFAGTTKIINANVQEFCSASSLFINDNYTNHQYTNVAPSYTNNNNIFNNVITGFNSTLKPTTSYAYKTTRDYNVTQPQAKQDGFYTQFTPFWTYNPATFVWEGSTGSSWQKMSNNKYYSPYGQLLESENSILRPSSQKFDYNQTLPALTASNAKYDEVGFNSFEDYNGIYGTLASINVTNVQNNDYLGFYNQLVNGTAPPVLDYANAHTGRTSLLFSANKNVKLTHDIYRSNPYPIYNDIYSGCTDKILNLSKLNFNDGGSVNGKRYIVSIWAKGITAATDYSSIVTVYGNVKKYFSPPGSTTNTSANVQLLNKSDVINGWQKLDYVFVIPQFSAPLYYAYTNLELSISSATNGFYLDDFRVQPYNSTMTCNVYDPKTLRLAAQLDDRNYATFIEYDSEGMLVRKKKETLAGIQTVQEIRKGVSK